MQLPRVAVKFADVTVTALTADGKETAIAGVDFAIVPPGASPTATTVWQPGSYDSGVAVILIAGPLCSPLPDGVVLVVPEPGGDLWGRVTDSPEVDLSLVGRISLV